MLFRSISDLVTPLFACYSILAALREKERTGKGQHLDASMMDSLVTLMFMENLEESIDYGLPLRTGNISRSGPTGAYSTRDGDVVISTASDDQWQRLVRALEAPELLEDPRFATYQTRTTHVEAARQEVQQRIGVLTRQEALERLERSDVPCAPVRSVAEVMEDRRLWQRGTLKPMRHGALPETLPGIVASGFPVVFSGGPLPELPGAPTLGQHNDEIYCDLLRITPEALQGLKEQGVV